MPSTTPSAASARRRPAPDNRYAEPACVLSDVAPTTRSPNPSPLTSQPDCPLPEVCSFPLPQFGKGLCVLVFELIGDWTPSLVVVGSPCVLTVMLARIQSERITGFDIRLQSIEPRLVSTLRRVAHRGPPGSIRDRGSGCWRGSWPAGTIVLVYRCESNFKVSRNAKACPNCGAKNPKKNKAQHTLDGVGSAFMGIGYLAVMIGLILNLLFAFS